jgi:hypothetical protein
LTVFDVRDGDGMEFSSVATVLTALGVRPAVFIGNSRGCISRRRFLGGSDARIIMGDDEDALARQWREKCGEAEPKDSLRTPLFSLAWPQRGLYQHSETLTHLA